MQVGNEYRAPRRCPHLRRPPPPFWLPLPLLAARLPALPRRRPPSPLMPPPGGRRPGVLDRPRSRRWCVRLSNPSSSSSLHPPWLSSAEEQRGVPHGWRRRGSKRSSARHAGLAAAQQREGASKGCCGPVLPLPARPDTCQSALPSRRRQTAAPCPPAAARRRRLRASCLLRSTAPAGLTSRAPTAGPLAGRAAPAACRRCEAEQGLGSRGGGGGGGQEAGQGGPGREHQEGGARAATAGDRAVRPAAAAAAAAPPPPISSSSSRGKQQHLRHQQPLHQPHQSSSSSPPVRLQGRYDLLQRVCGLVASAAPPPAARHQPHLHSPRPAARRGSGRGRC